MSVLSLWSRKAQIEKLNDIMAMLIAMEDIFRTTPDLARLIDIPKARAEVDYFIAAVSDSLDALRGGAPTILFRHNVIKAEQRVTRAYLDLQGVLNGQRAFRRRFSTS